jgi:class 3 adenylate cyclase/CHASE2 domain-containing sensor protein
LALLFFAFGALDTIFSWADMSLSSALFNKHWQEQYGLRPKKVAFWSLFWIAIGIVVQNSSWGDYLDDKIASPMQFRLREVLDLSPKQSPKLKIFAVDDQTFAYLGQPMPDLVLWSDILDGMGENKPKAIFIDAMFSAQGFYSDDIIQHQYSRLKSQMTDHNLEVVVGSFLSTKPVANKFPLPVDKPWYGIDYYNRKTGTPVKDVSMPSWLKGQRFAYGPAESFAQVFSKVGHFLLLEDNKIFPFLRIDDSHVIPHMTLFSADRVAFDRDNLRINDRFVALNRDGSMHVNFRKPDSWKIQSLLPTIKDVKQGYIPSGINEGDIVLILPLFYTGNTDFRPSPFGLMPGGLYLAAMINSVLNGEWLQPVLSSEVTLALIVTCSCVSLFLLPGWFFWVATAGLGIGISLVSIASFAYFGLVVPFVIPVAIGWLASTHLFTMRLLTNERKVLTLRAALDGTVDSNQLTGLLQNPDHVNFEPRERVVTLMFVDVVGFSLIAENLLPRIAFESLKKILGEMSDIIHSHNGVVDKSLGDGLLCYFGYRFDREQNQSNHAEEAVRCAIAIQEANIRNCLEAKRTGAPIFPLRIGLNTASCYLGNLGTETRIEFTVVGNGVNFAKRLEGACSMNSVLMSEFTYDLVKTVGLSEKAISRKLVRIKHHRELVDSFEYDPLYDQLDIRREIDEAFRDAANLQRLSERIQVRNRDAIKVSTNYGEAFVANFSGTGISLILATAVPKGVKLDCDFQLASPIHHNQLISINCHKVAAEVRWSYQSANGFVHGLSFCDLDDEQAEKMLLILTEIASDRPMEEAA